MNCFEKTKTCPQIVIKRLFDAAEKNDAGRGQYITFRSVGLINAIRVQISDLNENNE